MAQQSRFDPVCRSQSDLAFVLGVHTRTITSWKAEGMPGRRGSWNVRECLRWAIDEGKFVAEQSEVGMLSGAASPALEAFRGWKARLAELEYRQRRGQLLSEDSLRPFLEAVAALYRQLGEQLARDVGAAAVDSFNEVGEEVDLLIETFFRTDGGDDEPTA